MNYAAAAAAAQHFIFIEKAPCTMCVHRGGGGGGRGGGGGAWTLRRGRSYRFAGHNMFFHVRAFNNPDEAMDTEQTHSQATYTRFIEGKGKRERESGRQRERTVTENFRHYILLCFPIYLGCIRRPGKPTSLFSR